MARNRHLTPLGAALCLVIILSGCGDGVVPHDPDADPEATSTVRPGLGSSKPASDAAPVACRCCRAARYHGIRVVPLTQRSVPHCMPDHVAVCALHPAGDARVDDLQGYAMQVDIDYEPGGRLEFRVNGELVASERFEPTRVVTRGTLPRSVLDRLDEERGTLTWGYVPPKGEPTLKRVRIVSLTSKEERVLERLQERTPDDPMLYRLLRGLYFHQLGMYESARREALAVLELHPDEPHALALLSDALLGLDSNMTSQWIDLRFVGIRVLREREAAGTRCDLEKPRAPNERGPTGGC